MPCSCIRILTIVGQEEISKVGRLLPVVLGPISGGCTPKNRIYDSNSRISVRVIMIYFWHSLPGWFSKHKAPPSNTFADSYLVPACRILFIIRKSTGIK